MVKTLSSLITFTSKKLKQLFRSFSNVNVILGWQVFMKFLNGSTWTRTSEHIGVSPLTRKCVKKNSETSVVHDHVLFCKTVVCPENFSILANSSCNFKLEIQESILIKLLKPALNKNISSVPLHLFWYRLCNYTLFREYKE